MKPWFCANLIDEIGFSVSMKNYLLAILRYMHRNTEHTTQNHGQFKCYTPSPADHGLYTV
jgi:hypothetical protein